MIARNSPEELAILRCDRRFLAAAAKQAADPRQEPQHVEVLLGEGDEWCDFLDRYGVTAGAHEKLDSVLREIARLSGMQHRLPRHARPVPPGPHLRSDHRFLTAAAERASDSGAVDWRVRVLLATGRHEYGYLERSYRYYRAYGELDPGSRDFQKNTVWRRTAHTRLDTAIRELAELLEMRRRLPMHVSHPQPVPDYSGVVDDNRLGSVPASRPRAPEAHLKRQRKRP